MNSSQLQGSSLAALKLLEDLGYKNCDLILLPNQGDQHLVYKVTSHKGDLIARVSNEGSNGLKHQEKEWIVIEIARQRGVPAPEVYAVGLIQDYAVMLQEFIPGIGGDRATDQIAVWETLGRYAKIIHGIEVQGFGEDLIERNSLKFNDSWARFIRYNIESLSFSDSLIINSVLTPNEQQNVKQLFQSLGEKQHVFGLIHNDLAPKNVIVPVGPPVLIDWTCAEANIVPHWDLAEILANDPSRAALEAFRKGYELDQKRFNEIILQSYQLLLLRSCDKYRWAIDRSPIDVEGFGKIVRKIYNRVFV